MRLRDSLCPTVTCELIDNTRFRLAACQLDDLRACKSPYEITMTLKALPRTLDGTYDRILCKISDKSSSQYLRPPSFQARVILRWLVYSRRPLTLHEIAEVLAIDLEEVPQVNLEKRCHDPAEILTICPGLLATVPEVKVRGVRLWRHDPQDTDIVRLAHYSVQEYLVSNRIREGPAQDYGMYDGTSHAAIAGACLAYLQSIDKVHLALAEIRQRYPLADYAANYWMVHAREAIPPDQRLTDATVRFLNDRLDTFFTSLRLSEMVRPFLRAITPTSSELGSPLYYASSFGLTQVVKKMLAEASNVNALDTPQGELGGALHAAVWFGYADVVKLLLQRDIDANRQDIHGGTALHLAVYKGAKSVTAILLDRDEVEVDPKNYIGRTPLMIAAGWGNVEVVRQLLQTNAIDTNVRDQRGTTPLGLAASWGHAAVVESLLQNGSVDPNIRDNKRRTPLYLATRRGHVDVVRTLLKNKLIDVNATEKHGSTPLHSAARHGFHDIVKILLQDDRLDTEVKDREHRTPLLVAVNASNKQAASLLLQDPRVDPNAKDYKGHTVYTYALQKNHDALTEVSLEDGKADLDGTKSHTTLSI